MNNDIVRVPFEGKPKQGDVITDPNKITFAIRVNYPRGYLEDLERVKQYFEGRPRRVIRGLDGDLNDGAIDGTCDNESTQGQTLPSTPV